DRLVRVIPPRVVGFAQIDRELLQVAFRPHRAAAEGGGEMPFPQLDEQLLARIVVEAGQRLEREIARGSKAVFGQMRTADDVGIDGQSREYLLRKSGATEPRVMDPDAAGALQAQAVQVIGELPAVARAGAAENQIGQNGGGAEAVDRVGR